MRHLLLWSALGACLALGCGGETADVGERRSEWLARAPETYVVGACSYGFTPTGCELTAVERGAVIAAEKRLDEWQPIAEAREPIEALFAAAEGNEGCELEIEFDADYSFPVEFWVDCGEEGWGARVECFEAGTTDLEACRARTVWKP